MSTFSNRPPGTIVLAGRTLAYSSNSFRSPTLTERNPVPTGVVSGPLSASRVRRMLSTVASGSGVPVASTAAMPASSSSQSNRRPVASSTFTVCGGDLGPDAVARDERDVVGHGPAVDAGGRRRWRRPSAAAGRGARCRRVAVRHMTSPAARVGQHERRGRPATTPAESRLKPSAAGMMTTRPSVIADQARRFELQRIGHRRRSRGPACTAWPIWSGSATMPGLRAGPSSGARAGSTQFTSGARPMSASPKRESAQSSRPLDPVPVHARARVAPERRIGTDQGDRQRRRRSGRTAPATRRGRSWYGLDFTPGPAADRSRRASARFPQRPGSARLLASVTGTGSNGPTGARGRGSVIVAES